MTAISNIDIRLVFVYLFNESFLRMQTEKEIVTFRGSKEESKPNHRKLPNKNVCFFTLYIII
jgi:hypothetical protein